MQIDNLKRHQQSQCRCIGRLFTAGTTNSTTVHAVKGDELPKDRQGENIRSTKMRIRPPANKDSEEEERSAKKQKLQTVERSMQTSSELCNEDLTTALSTAIAATRTTSATQTEEENAVHQSRQNAVATVHRSPFLSSADFDKLCADNAIDWELLPRDVVYRVKKMDMRRGIPTIMHLQDECGEVIEVRDSDDVLKKIKIEYKRHSTDYNVYIKSLPHEKGSNIVFVCK